jgi:hypothetical protein
MNPYTLLGGAVGGLLLLIAAFFFGRSVGIDHQQAIDAKTMEKAVRAVKKTQDAIDQMTLTRASVENIRQETVREIYREIPKIIDRPVYRNICADVDGVRLIDRAASNANGQSGSDAASDAQPAAAIPPKG